MSETEVPPPSPPPLDRGGVLPVPAEPLERILGYLLEFFPLFFVSMIPWIGGLVGTAYVLLRDGLYPGQSLGKRFMRTQVIVRATGLPATYRESVIRNSPLAIHFFLSIVPLIGHFVGAFAALAVYLVELMLVIFDAQHRRIGDLLADTVVVKLPADPASPVSSPMEFRRGVTRVVVPPAPGSTDSGSV